MKPTAIALATLALAGLVACAPPPVAEPPPPPPVVAPLPRPVPLATGAEFQGAPPPGAFESPVQIEGPLPPPTMPPPTMPPPAAPPQQDPAPAAEAPAQTGPVPLFEALR